MENTVQVHDQRFRLMISQKQIAEKVTAMAAQLNDVLRGKYPLFLPVLNGSFIFAADLLREVTIPCSISFIKIASYQGMQSTGAINALVGLNEKVAGRPVVIIEDIVDSGNTIEHIIRVLKEQGASEILVATLLFKKEAYTKSHRIDHAGFEIDNDFVVGYGLDYNGMGRNLKEIYKLA